MSKVKAAIKKAPVCGAQRGVVSAFAACDVLLFLKIFYRSAAA